MNAIVYRMSRVILWYGILCYPMLCYGIESLVCNEISMLCFAMVYVVKDKHSIVSRVI